MTKSESNRKYYLANIEHLREVKRMYARCRNKSLSPKEIRVMRERTRNSVKNWRVKYPERVTAHRKVFIELRAGRIKKVPCICGSLKVEAHHEDYSKPLEIVWLCKQHHAEADMRRRKLV